MSRTRGWVEERRDGRARVRATIDGKRRQVGPWWPSRAIADEKCAAWNAAVDADLIVAPADVTFGSEGERWLERREKKGRVRGIDQEIARWRAHVRTAPFYDTPLESLTRRAVSDWIDELVAKKAVQAFRGPAGVPVRIDTGRTLARATVQQCLRLVRTALDDALEQELVAANVARDMKVPMFQRDEDLEDAWTYLDATEIGLVTTCAALDELRRLLFTVTIFTGMRRGEVFALRWGDVHEADPTRPRIIVRRGHKGGTKSHRPREVPLFAPARASFVRLRELAIDTDAADLVFPNPDGEMYASSYDAAWSDRRQRTGTRGADGTRAIVTLPGAKSRAGIARDVRFHDMRHTFCSHLVMGTWGRRWSLEEIRVVAGHSTIKVTERYAHLAPDGLHAAARETNGGHAPATTPAVPIAIANLSILQPWAGPGSNRGPAPCKGGAGPSSSDGLATAGVVPGAIAAARELLALVMRGEHADEQAVVLAAAVLTEAPPAIRLALEIQAGDAFALSKGMQIAELVLGALRSTSGARVESEEQ